VLQHNYNIPWHLSIIVPLKCFLFNDTDELGCPLPFIIHLLGLCNISEQTGILVSILKYTKIHDSSVIIVLDDRGSRV
jgi:hypothetical protein